MWVLFSTPGHMTSMPRPREVKRPAQSYMAKLVSGRAEMRDQVCLTPVLDASSLR